MSTELGHRARAATATLALARCVFDFDPNQHRDEKGKWSDGLDEPGRLDGEAYGSSYGDTVDDAGIDLNDGMKLSGRFFESGDGHLVIDHPDGSSVVIAELDGPEQLRRLGYEIEFLVGLFEDDGESGDERVGDLYLEMSEVGDLSITDANNIGASISLEEARELASKMGDLADTWEDYESDAADDDGEGVQ